jgi:hypothetical protein
VTTGLEARGLRTEVDDAGVRLARAILGNRKEQGAW